MSEENPKPTNPWVSALSQAKRVYDDAKTAIFHMQKSNLFRTVHADGIWCSKAPRGLVHLMFYVERNPLPTVTYYDLENGALGDEQIERRVIKSGYLREVEVSAVVDRNALLALHAWIGTYLEETKLEPNHVPAPV